MISGWGGTEKKSSSDVLKIAELKGLNNQNCQNKFDARRPRQAISITNSMICAYEISKDACFGDSGGKQYL
jgi:hypothetical protein